MFGGLAELGFERADVFVGFHKAGQESAHHCDAGILIELRQCFRLRPRGAGLAIDLRHDFSGAQVTARGTIINLVEHSSGSQPIFAQNARLQFAAFGELVVVLLEEGGLSVADQGEQRHSGFWFLVPSFWFPAKNQFSVFLAI